MLIHCQNPTQLNSTQSNSKATSVGVRHSSHVYPTHICCGTSHICCGTSTTTNSNSTIKTDPRDLKFCMRPHLSKQITTQHNINPTNYWGGGLQTLPPGLTLTNLFGTKILLRQLTTTQHNFGTSVGVAVGRRSGG